MAFSTVCEYAIRALTRLALAEEGGRVQSQEIADSEGIPRQFLAKILGQLRDKEWVRAYRGPGGGYALAKPPTEICVMDVVNSIDGRDSIRRRCVLGLDDCNDSQPCPMHDTCRGFKELYLSKLSSMTLATMAETVARKREMQA
jgi:Rrf2 family protein